MGKTDSSDRLLRLPLWVGLGKSDIMQTAGTLVYTLAHGLMLFNRGVYWDDWVLYNMDKGLIIDTFKQAGVFWVGYLHVLVSGGGE